MVKQCNACGTDNSTENSLCIQCGIKFTEYNSTEQNQSFGHGETLKGYLPDYLPELVAKPLEEGKPPKNSFMRFGLAVIKPEPMMHIQPRRVLPRSSCHACKKSNWGEAITGKIYCKICGAGYRSYEN